MKLKLSPIVFSILLFSGCHQTTPETHSKLIPNTINNRFKSYMDGMILGHSDTIQKYLYKGVGSYFQEHTAFEFDINSYIRDSIVKPAQQAQISFRQQGLTLFYNVLPSIRNTTIKETEFYLLSYELKVTDTMDQITYIDTLQSLGISNNGKLGFMNIGQSHFDILCDNFSLEEVDNIEKFIYGISYQEKVLKRNLQLLKKHSWQLVAFGPSSSELYELTSSAIDDLLSNELGNLPEIITLIGDGKKAKITSIANQREIVPLTLTHNEISIKVKTELIPAHYRIISTGAETYYLDLTFENSTDKKLVFSYVSF